MELETIKKKNLILVGNKPAYKIDLNKIIDSFDYVLRISRMNNFRDTGNRIDGIYLEANDEFKYIFKGGENKEEIKRAKNIFMHQYWYDNFREWESYVTKKQYESIEIINHKAAIRDIGFERPTSAVLMLAYLLNSSWKDKFHIHITCLDVENRAALIDNNPLWGYHNGAGIVEENYLKKLIEYNIIKRIKDE